MSSLVVEKLPTKEPVTLDEAKLFLRVALTDDDNLISGLITAAREVCEVFTNRSFCFKGYRQGLDSFPYYTDSVMSQMAYPPSYYALPRYSTTLWNYSQMIKLYAPPLVSVERITYLGTDSQFHDLVATPKLWYPGTAYSALDLVMDVNANIQKCTLAGTSNAQPPVWNKTLNGSTVEQNSDPLGEGTVGVTWQNQGPLNPQIGTSNPSQFGMYIVDSSTEPARIFPGPPGSSWPPVLYVPNAVQIHFTAGYSEDGSKVPSSIKTAMLQLIGNWYENREAAMLGNFSNLPNHVRMLLWSERIEDFQPTRG